MIRVCAAPHVPTGRRVAGGPPEGDRHQTSANSVLVDACGHDRPSEPCADELDDAPTNGRAPSASIGDPIAWIEVL